MQYLYLKNKDSFAFIVQLRQIQCYINIKKYVDSFGLVHVIIVYSQ